MATSRGGRRAEAIPLMRRHELARFREAFAPHESAGGIPLPEVLQNVLTLCNNRGEELPEDVRQRIVRRADVDHDGRLNYNEFVHLMTVQEPRLRARSKFQKVVQIAVSSVVPDGATRGTGEDMIESYTEHYNCCPPPLFVIIISAVELVIFIGYFIARKSQSDVDNPAAAPRDSPLIYQPARRYEAWRFLTYMLIHDGYGHLIGNMIFQLVLGIPLEMVHKFWRVGTVYCLGVITGSLATSVTDPWTLLCGASGGCYALIAAHFAKIIMNWKEMTHEWLSGPLKLILSAPVQLIFFSLYMSVDTGFAIYMRFFSPEASRTAFVAHFAGFLGGMLIGIPVLKNLKEYDWERKVRWVALAVFIALIVFAVLFNILYDAHYPPADWRQCCPLPCSYYPNCDAHGA